MTEKVVTIPEIAPSEYVSSSQCIHKGPCIVKAVHVSSTADAGTCDVYDGVNDKGRLKANIAVADYQPYTWRPGDGTDFDYGIYVKVSSGLVTVTVTYIPESRKAFI